MKKIFFGFISLALLFLAQSCDKELPYPIDQVKRGVLIDVVRVPGTDGVLTEGVTAGNYKVKLTIPENQGDYSFMKNAQLLAVFQDVNGKKTSKVVIDNITQFPQDVTIDMADVYSKFGLTEPALGEVLNFTANVILNDGSIIPGWTEITGFNNVPFAGWQVNGRPYSSNVRYAVACPLDLNDFVGTCYVTLDEWWGEEPYPVEITKISDTELSIEGLFEEEAENPLIITVDPTDHTISFGKQILAPNSGDWWGRPAYNNFALSAGKGTINACELIISFSASASVDAGNFGAVSFEIEK